MAKVSLDLNQFKANGVYTVEYDESEQTVINTQQLRLIVGFSRKGPFNAPVFLKDTKSARKIFGEIDTLLEKKGSFFHRSIETALRYGPVYALNLLPLDNTPTGDKIEYRSFSLSMTEENSDTATALYSSFYNKERFWKPDTSYFEGIINNNLDAKNKLISFTNLGQTPVSILVRKSKGITGFDITARDFYGDNEMPAYVSKFAYIRDYFIDIYAIRGDWTDYANLSIDPDFSKYFSATGVNVSTLDKFLSSDKVTLIGSWTGCIIPDFTDLTGANQYIETIVNNSQQLTGIFMSINRDALEDYENSEYHVDLIGNSVINATSAPKTINMLSYVSPLVDAIDANSDNNSSVDVNTTYEFSAEDFGSEQNYYPYVKSTPYSDSKGHFFNTLVIPKPRTAFKDQLLTNDDYVLIMNTLSTSSLIKTKNSFAKVYSLTNTGDSIEVVYSPKTEVDYSSLEESITIKVDKLGVVEFTSGEPAIITSSTVDVKEFFVYIPSKKGYAKLATEDGETWTVQANGDSECDKWWLELDDLTKNKTFEAICQTFIDEYADYVPSFIDVESSLGSEEGTIELAIDPDVVDVTKITSDGYFRVYPGNELFTEIKNNSLINGDKIAYDNTGVNFYYIAYEENEDEYGLPVYDIYQYEDEDLLTLTSTPITFSGDSWSYEDGEIVEPDITTGEAFKVVVYSDHNTISENVYVVNNTMNTKRTSFQVSKAYSSKVEVGDYLVADASDGSYVLTRVISKKKVVNSETNVVTYVISVNEPIHVYEDSDGSPSDTFVKRYLDINNEDFTTTLQFTKLGGFAMNSYHMPNGTDSQMEKILSVIENTNVGKTLEDNDIIQFRYVIDTFDGGIAPMMGAKVILSRLAMNKQKCMAILNAPSINKFINSTDPIFTEVPDPENGIPKPVLNCEYIAQGGNLSIGPGNTFSLPDEDNGAKFCGVFTPFIKIREYGKDKMIPPAADVSNNFIAKFIKSQPYAIAAGPRRGIISNPAMTGLEYEFLKEERGYLEPIGLNCLKDDRTYGPMIYGNATAYQKTLTAFNNLHVRDLLITIETDIEDILSNYVFEFNDAVTRLEIKTIVNEYLEGVKTAQGIYDFMVIMDETNNTPTVIDQNIGILDIGIEPARGMQKIINRVTVLKTGAISSGGFTIN